MEYDVIKYQINKYIKNRYFRKIFYFFLDLLILRQWYIKREIKKLIKKLEKEKKTFLLYDAGSGLCQYSDFVLSKYKHVKVVALDIKKDFLETYSTSLSYERRSRFSFYTGDLTSFSMPLEKSDIILAVDILEHIEDDISVLKNFHKSIKDSGYLIISTPTNNNKINIDEHVRNGYSINDLTNKLNISGFEVVYSEYTYGFWGRIHWRLVMYNSIRLIKISKIFVFFLPLYLLLILIPSLIFMWFDLIFKNKDGNGMIVVAKAL